MEFNLNDIVQVKLTQKGLDILRTKHEELRRLIPKLPEWKPPKTDDEGWSEHQLWCLMEDFGPHIHIGADGPMETTIRLGRREPQRRSE